MRASIIVMVLFLAFTSGCFGSRTGSNGELEGLTPESGVMDSGRTNWPTTGGAGARLDVRRYPVCGNNIKDDGEICDGTDLAGATCDLLVRGQVGELQCARDCLNYDTTMCYVYVNGYGCGNNVKEEGEICDGTELAGATCDSLAAGQVGTLSCAPDCRSYETSMCYTPGRGFCGNAIREVGETCDGPDLGGATCSSLAAGYYGTLSCIADCLNFDMTMCFPSSYDDAGLDDLFRTPVSEGCARSTGAQCESDENCLRGGCSGELCYNPVYGQIATTCDCAAPTNLSCGCVDGVCTWWSGV